MARICTIFALLSILTTVSYPTLPTVITRQAHAAAGVPDRRFGAVETYDAPMAAREMGAGWTRVPFLWAEIQPNGSDEWFPQISDAALALEIAQGRQPVGLIITTPSWATDVGIGPGVPNGLHTGHNDPGNLWAGFLRRLVATYSGRIDHWIIWNEPDVWDAAHPGYTWGGSVTDFLQLQRVAYMAIKETNPGAQVIFSGTSYWWDAAYGRDLYFRKYLDALVQDQNASGNNYYCDAVALHIYFQPDFVYSITALYHQLMREHGFDKPVWIAETNAAPSLDPQMPVPNSQFAITLDEQAAYIVQAYAMGIAGGAARIAVFKMIDTPSDLTANPEPFGLVRANGSRRPAFHTYRVATTYMAGFQGGRLEQRPDVSIVTIPRASGTTTVAWTRTPTPTTIQIPASASSATLVDMWGNRRSISASDGVYTVSLPGASCTHSSPCIIGGSPYLVVEGRADVMSPPVVSDETRTTEDENTASQQAAEETVSTTPTRTARPEYSVSLRPIEIKGAEDVWRKRALPGYKIDLISGPPFHLYELTVLNEIVTEARRSLNPLTISLNDLDPPWRRTPITTTMATLYNRYLLRPYTVEGLFERVTHYHEDSPASPACDTQVTVRLNGDWAFPRHIAEQWSDDCQGDGEPSWLSVIAFATLTPTPTRAPTPTLTALPATKTDPTMTPRPSATAPVPTTPAASINPTSASPPATRDNTPIWIILIAGIAVAAVVLFRRSDGGGKSGP